MVFDIEQYAEQYAAVYLLEGGDPANPTDEAMKEIFSRCARPAEEREYAAIRRAIPAALQDAFVAELHRQGVSDDYIWLCECQTVEDASKYYGWLPNVAKGHTLCAYYHESGEVYCLRLFNHPDEIPHVADMLAIDLGVKE